MQYETSGLYELSPPQPSAEFPLVGWVGDTFSFGVFPGTANVSLDVRAGSWSGPSALQISGMSSWQAEGVGSFYVVDLALPSRWQWVYVLPLSFRTLGVYYATMGGVLHAERGCERRGEPRLRADGWGQAGDVAAVRGRRCDADEGRGGSDGRWAGWPVLLRADCGAEADVGDGGLAWRGVRVRELGESVWRQVGARGADWQVRRGGVRCVQPR